MSSISSGLFVSPWRWSMRSIFPPALPCSYFLFICLICLKQQTVRTKKSKFLRGCFWVCTDVFPHKKRVFIIYIDLFFFSSSTPVISSQTCDNNLSEPYTHLILSLIHNSILTLMFHLHVPETDIWRITMNYKCMLSDSLACFCCFGCQNFSIACR